METWSHVRGCAATPSEGVSDRNGPEHDDRVPDSCTGTGVRVAVPLITSEDDDVAGREHETLARGRELDRPLLAGEVLARTRRVRRTRHPCPRRKLEPLEHHVGNAVRQERP